MDIFVMAVKLFTKNGMVASFMVLGLITFIAYKMGGLTKGRVHGSAIAIFLGLVLAYFGGSVTGGSKGIVNIDGIIKDAENNEQTVQRMVLFTQSSYGSSPVWISQKIQISNRETAPASLIQELLPDFFLTNTSVSNVDFFALNRETYLITKEGIPYLYCQNYALPENE